MDRLSSGTRLESPQTHSSCLIASNIKQKQAAPKADLDLVILEQRLKRAAKASFETAKARLRSEIRPVPDRQEGFKPQGSSCQAQALVSEWPSLPRGGITSSRPTLPSMTEGQLNLHDVELILATLNRRMSDAQANSNIAKQERLSRERERVLGVLRQLNIEHLRSKAAGTVRSRTHEEPQRSTGKDASTHRHTPSTIRCASIDRYIPNNPHATSHHSTDRYTSTDRYVPGDRYGTTDRYIPQYSEREPSPKTKRIRNTSPEEEMEAMADMIGQVSRLTKRMTTLQASRPAKRRRGAAVGLGAALLASVEELLIKTKDVTG
ncbi:MAG: hypothetical protein Q9166_004984 [cf. Caloplaca sp. 2 TL-2023]